MIYGLIGEKLSHSYSKEIHKELGQEGYGLFEIPPEDLEDFLKSEELGGLNVTIPYKRAVMPLCDSLSPQARRIGSVNTLVYDEQRRLRGCNTDYDGFVYMLKQKRISVKGKKALIFGSGGTSLTARAALQDLGASEIVVASRQGGGASMGGISADCGDVTGGSMKGSPTKTGPMETGLLETGSMETGPVKTGPMETGGGILFIGYDELEMHRDSQILVNATPVGMYPHCPKAVVDLKDFKDCRAVVEVIYNPHRTMLALQAMDLGIPVTQGLDMLAAQAKAAEELFTGKRISDQEVERIIRKLGLDRQNLVLTGMPGSGKTAVGAAAAKLLQREFLDIDTFIEQQEGASVAELFEKIGEEGFRILESEAIHAAGRKTSRVIAVGGGAVLDENNYFPLKQNGYILRIERKLEQLATIGRPLSKDLHALKEMYQKRLPHYLRFADGTVENRTTIEAAAERAVQLFQLAQG